MINKRVLGESLNSQISYSELLPRQSRYGPDAVYRYKKPDIPLKRHGVIELGDGYLYRNWKKLPNKMYLKCAMIKEISCKASYVVEIDKSDPDKEIYRCLTEHNHPPNELCLNSARFLSALEQAVQILPGSTKQIFDHIIEGYLRCSGYKSTGCRGKGYVMKGKGIESFVLLSEHSHPPNYLMEKRSEIAKTLKEFAATIPGKPIQVYNSVVSIYPEIEQLWPFSRAVRTINRIRQKTGFMRGTL